MAYGDLIQLSAISSISQILTVTPDDDADLSAPARAIYLETAGDVALITTGGTEITLKGLAVGAWHPILVQRIKATGTTVAAGGIKVGR